jgi:hypothetical protein
LKKTDEFKQVANSVDSRRQYYTTAYTARRCRQSLGSRMFVCVCVCVRARAQLQKSCVRLSRRRASSDGFVRRVGVVRRPAGLYKATDVDVES